MSARSVPTLADFYKQARARRTGKHGLDACPCAAGHAWGTRMERQAIYAACSRCGAKGGACTVLDPPYGQGEPEAVRAAIAVSLAMKPACPLCDPELAESAPLPPEVEHVAWMAMAEEAAWDDDWRAHMGNQCGLIGALTVWWVAYLDDGDDRLLDLVRQGLVHARELLPKNGLRSIPGGRMLLHEGLTAHDPGACK